MWLSGADCPKRPTAGGGTRCHGRGWRPQVCTTARGRLGGESHRRGVAACVVGSAGTADDVEAVTLCGAAAVETRRGGFMRNGAEPNEKLNGRGSPSTTRRCLPMALVTETAQGDNGGGLRVWPGSARGAGLRMLGISACEALSQVYHTIEAKWLQVLVLRNAAKMLSWHHQRAAPVFVTVSQLAEESARAPPSPAEFKTCRRRRRPRRRPG